MKFKDMPYERIDFEKSRRRAYRTDSKPCKRQKAERNSLRSIKSIMLLTDRVTTQATLCSIRHSIDTTDQFYQEEQDYYDRETPAYSNLCIAYQKELFSSPYRRVLEEKIGPVAFKNMEIAMKSVSDEIVPLMQEENASGDRI